MIAIEEHVSLASHTTLGVGGTARFFALCTSDTEVQEALSYARDRALKVALLGGGSNTLVPDGEFNGLVLKIAVGGITFEDDGDAVLVTSGAGASWDRVVAEASKRDLWGIENLAAIPGTIGGAVVQNIGAYGVELSQTFMWADTILLSNGTSERVLRDDAEFAYRTSIFKKQNSQVITRVALRLSHTGAPNLTYPDLARMHGEGGAFSTPAEIAEAVRGIRARKFPQHEGTAGSFFKNPIVEKAVADTLRAQFKDIVTYPMRDGKIKISLAWVLDHALHLKGYREGGVRLFERQPLVLVADHGTSASEVNAFADLIAEKVKYATNLTIEREVETFGV